MNYLLQRRVIIPALAVVGLAAVWYGLQGEVQPGADAPIQVGAVLPLTGSASNYGESIRKGLDLAAAEINDAGGVDGRRLEIVYGDDRTETIDTVSEAIKLLDVDQVDVLIGGVWDFLAEATLPVVKDRGAVLMIPSDVAEVIVGKQREYPSVFVLHSPLAAHRVSIEQFLRQVEGTRVAIMVPNSTWGHIMTDMFKAGADGVGYEVVKEILLTDFDDNDMASEMALLNAAAPDAVLLAINPNDAAQFMRKYHELGFRAPVLASWEMAISYLDGNIPATQMENVTIYTFSDPDARFAQKHVAAYGEAPGIHADVAYDTLFVLKEALEKADTHEPAAIAAALKNISAFEGASGRIDLTEHNYPQNKESILKIFKNGELVPFS